MPTTVSLIHAIVDNFLQTWPRMAGAFALLAIIGIAGGFARKNP